MKRFFSIVLLIFLLSLNISGCVYDRTPRITEVVRETEAIEPTTELNTYELNGNRYKIGDTYRIEQAFFDGYIRVYDSNELTEKILLNRKGTLIIERCIGVVTDANNGDGRVLNAQNRDFNYISYRNCDQDYTNGTVLVTFLVYNPMTEYTDDIIDRYDYVITREYERE